MEELTQWTIDTLDKAREQINKSTETVKDGLTKAATGFIELGYTFRQVAEKKLYVEGGYETLQEYAMHEHGYSASQVSRFQELNKEYSVDGNTPLLDDKWKGYSQSNLVEMLKLPEQIREVIEPDMKRDDLRQLTKDIESANEAAKEEEFINTITGAEEEEPVDRVILDIIKAPKVKERFEKIFDQLMNQGTDRDICMTFTENGFGNLSLRTSTIFFKGNMVKIVINDVVHNYSYSDLLDAVRKKRMTGGETAAEYFENLTGEKLHDEIPASNVEKAASSEKETPKPKTETKKTEKPEVKHCETAKEEEKPKEENPLPKPADDIDVVDPGEVEAADIKECKIYGEGTFDYINISHFAKEMYIFKGGIQIASYKINFCPKCGARLGEAHE